MADKMIRMAGRASDGTAKPIKTDAIGNLGVFPVGNTSECRRLGIAITVPANDSHIIETPVSTIVDSSKAINVFDKFELSYFSCDGFGKAGTSIQITHHRETGNIDYLSKTAEFVLTENNGLIKADGDTYYIDHQGAQTIKNRFITIKFINDTASSIGVYYPTMILK